MSRFLRRAIEAEAQLESARERIAELEGHMHSMIRAAADPLLVARAERLEELLKEVVSGGLGVCTPQWMSRVRAQLVAGHIFKRDEV